MPHDVENKFFEAETLARNLDVNYTIDNNSITINGIQFDKPELALIYLNGYKWGFSVGFEYGTKEGFNFRLGKRGVK